MATSNSYPDLFNTPTLGTAASKNVGTTSADVAQGDHTHTLGSLGAAAASDLIAEITRATGAEGSLNTTIATNTAAIANLPLAPLKSAAIAVTGDMTLLQGDLRPDLSFTGARTAAETITFPATGPYMVFVTNDTTGTGTLNIKKAGGSSNLVNKGETVRFRVS